MTALTFYANDRLIGFGKEIWNQFLCTTRNLQVKLAGFDNKQKLVEANLTMTSSYSKQFT